MASDIRFLNDDVLNDDLTSSDEEYDANEKQLLKKYKNSQQHDSEDELEVLGVRSGDSDDESDKSEIALSDVEDNDDDNIPDARAWGKEKKKYYGTDYVDPDYGGFDGKDAQAAEIEEEEAKHIQSQLVQQLDDNDFSLDVIFKSKDKEAKIESEEVVKTDYTVLTNKQKIDIIQKESPEFFGLIDDVKGKMEIAKKYLKPAMENFKKDGAELPVPILFIESYYNLILNYATNIYMYLLLKSNKELNNHPVIKTLYQYRQLLSKMEPTFEEIIRPQLILLLEGNQDVEKPKEVKKLLNILSKQKTVKENKRNKENMVITKMEEASPIQPSNKKVRFMDQSSDPNASDIDEAMEVNAVEQENEPEEVGKRAITYQIAKNKGLTPNRKKEYRNPRVKHKLKYRKALIRRKGAVREPRKELTRYGGEMSGIKASVSKSIKLKS